MTSSALSTARSIALDIGERAVKTFAQTLLAYFGAGALDVLHANWTAALSLAAGATILSILSSVASLSVGKSGTASLTNAVVPADTCEPTGRHSAPGQDAAWLEDIKAPTFRLGRLPNDPAKPRVRLTADLAPALTPPAAVDWHSNVPADSWGMDGNDRVGDCTCAEVDHTLKSLQVAAGNPEVQSTTPEVLAAYSAVTGYDPARPSTDRGAMMQDVRAYWRKHGVTLGGKPHSILLFAQIDHTSHNMVKLAIARFGAMGLGFNFPASAMDQFNAGRPWTVVPGSQVDGGHAVSAVGYDDQWLYVVTWGRVQKMAWSFFDKYVDECWTQLTEEFVSATKGTDPLAETAYQLGQQFEALTGEPNPIPAPQPAPQPTPSPSPSPVSVAEWLQAHPNVVRWANHVPSLKKRTHLEAEAAADIRSAEQ